MKKRAFFMWVALLAMIASCFISHPLEARAAKGLTGFSYTQDNIFISSAQGSQIVNIPIYGWGSLWPFSEGNNESDNGHIINQRILQAAQNHQQVVLTCASAPSIYRESGQPWIMDERVTDSMEDQYAQRCAQAAQRWPQITRVQVWNELKGYWLMPPANRWDYEGYTRFYNKVYNAIKSVRPDVKVGGGYAVLSAEGYGFDKSYNGVLMDSRAVDAMQYWLKNAQGYDAVCLDGSFAPKDFAKVTTLFRSWANNKPIWWSEFYSDSVTDMRAAKVVIERYQAPGDIALWWAESRFPW